MFCQRDRKSGRSVIIRTSLAKNPVQIFLMSVNCSVDLNFFLPVWSKRKTLGVSFFINDLQKTKDEMKSKPTRSYHFRRRDHILHVKMTVNFLPRLPKSVFREIYTFFKVNKTNPCNSKKKKKTLRKTTALRSRFCAPSQLLVLTITVYPFN